ncbi:MAG: hypothetical protein ACSLFD_08370 [Solirubrobacterales bacterium]
MSISAQQFERIALTRLPELQVASGLFRANARIEDVEDEGSPSTTLRAGAVVLLGLLRADQNDVPHPFSTGSLRTRVLGDLSGEDVSPGDLGLALWAESRGDGGAVSEIHGLMLRQIHKRLDLITLDELSWIVSGLTESSVRFGDEAGLNQLLEDAASELAGRALEDTGLLQDVHRRRRGVVTPVGSQFHALNALSQLVRAGHTELVGDRAAGLAKALLALQRENGAWPGLVDPQRGEAAAYYPVLAVTQVAHAQTSLRRAASILEGIESDAACNLALAWANGGNVLKFDLIHEEEARMDRGILPRKEPGAVQRGFTTAARRIRGRLQEPDASRLILDPAVSSEDLGWVLEAWAGR